MRIQVNKILSLATDGASCHLLTIGEDVKILLDCGMPHNFNFKQYKKYQKQIEQVQLILISHSSLQYSGALPLLISEFGIDAKKVYTTQPIMRYAPLNFHEQFLNFRNPNYQKKLFNNIYSFYEEIHLVKPYQKKSITVQNHQQKGLDSSQSMISLLKSSSKTIRFSCYQAGGSLGSLCWKIHMGLINVLYLVDYTNYSLNHISGLDLESIRNQPISLLITDMYPVVQDQKLKKQKLYNELRKVLIDFYQRNNIDPVHPKPMCNEDQNKLLITCYPNQMLIEIMVVMKKIVTDLQEPMMRQKINVIHLSSRYLQLIKSQVEHFAEQFKPTIDKIDEYFLHSRSMVSRISVCSFSQVNGILNPAVANPLNNVEIYHVGQRVSTQLSKQQFQDGRENILQFKILKDATTSIVQATDANQIKKVQEKIEAEEENQDIHNNNDHVKVQNEEANSQFGRSQVNQDPFLLTNSIQGQIQLPFGTSSSVNVNVKQEKQNIDPSNLQLMVSDNSKPKALVGKYLSQIGFPHFVKSHKQENFDFNDYGLKHHLEPSSRPARRTINDYAQGNDQLPQLNLTPKKSTVQVMNIEFGLDPKLYYVDFDTKINNIHTVVNRTNYSSALKILEILNPKHTVFINSQKDQATQKLFKMYRSNLKNQAYNISASPKNQCLIVIENELIEYKVNYLAMGQNSLQKVKGRIQCVKGAIHLHLECLEQKEVLDFRLEKFYRQCKKQFGKSQCKFTGHGVMIAGIRIYREGSQIVLQGEYSESYFKVRKILYVFLKIR